MSTIRCCASVVEISKVNMNAVTGIISKQQKSLFLHLQRPTTTTIIQQQCGWSYSSSTTTRHLTTTKKVGTPLQGLDVFKDKDAPVVLERDQYPEWVWNLPKPLLTFAQLRRMPNKDATLKDIHRFLRLKRRIKIKENNERKKDS